MKPTENQIGNNPSVRSSTEMCKVAFVTCLTSFQGIISRQNIAKKSGEARNLGSQLIIWKWKVKLIVKLLPDLLQTIVQFICNPFQGLLFDFQF